MVVTAQKFENKQVAEKFDQRFLQKCKFSILFWAIWLTSNDQNFLLADD
jgi:hypothetical protein